MRQLTLFGVPVRDEPAPAADPLLTATRGQTASTRYTLTTDLALWVRDEAVARGWSPDVVVRYAVALMQQNTVWGGESASAS